MLNGIYLELLDRDKVEGTNNSNDAKATSGQVLHPGDGNVEGFGTSDREPTGLSEIDWFTLSVKRGMTMPNAQVLSPTITFRQAVATCAFTFTHNPQSTCLSQQQPTVLGQEWDYITTGAASIEH